MKHLLKFTSLLIVGLIFLLKTANAQELTYRMVNVQELLGTAAFKELNQKFYTAATAGKIQAYKDKNLKELLSTVEVNQVGKEQEPIEISDPETGEFYDTILYHELNLDDIEGYMITEIWEISPDNKKYTIKINGFAFAWTMYVEGQDLGKEALFWVSFADLTKVFTDVEMKNLTYAIIDVTKSMHSMKFD